VAARLGLEPGPRTVWVAITGFGSGNEHERRAGHDLNYLGWAGVLGSSVPPVTVADYTGAFAAVRDALAGLLERERSGRGVRVEVSMTHESNALHVPEFLRGGAACYRVYTTADGRGLTIAALEHRFWRRLCELVRLPELESRAYEPRLPELEAAIGARSLAAWLELFDGEDVCAGPVRTREEAAEFEAPLLGPAPALGEHNELWRREVAS
jgi:alpha-methylacyl-CoA racemase